MKLVELTVPAAILPFVKGLLEHQGVEWQVGPYNGHQQLRVWCGLADAVELEEHLYLRRHEAYVLGRASNRLRVQIGRIRNSIIMKTEYLPARRNPSVCLPAKRRGVSSDLLRGRSIGVDAKVRWRAKATPRPVVHS